MESTTTRFFFDTKASAAEALVTLLTDARTTKATYRFHGLSVDAVMQSGLVLEGEIASVSGKIGSIAGATRHDE